MGEAAASEAGLSKKKGLAVKSFRNLNVFDGRERGPHFVPETEKSISDTENVSGGLNQRLTN